jgi:hypothetical protein
MIKTLITMLREFVTWGVIYLRNGSHWEGDREHTGKTTSRQSLSN